jgi:acetoin utilization deacetylase AcuC-like enzyme
MYTPIFYDPRQNVAGLDSFSKSAGKPARFVEFMQAIDVNAYSGDLGAVEPLTREDLYRVHDRTYVDGVFAGTESNGFGNNDLRVPESCLWTAGSLLAASRWALSYPHITAARQPLAFTTLAITLAMATAPSTASWPWPPSSCLRVPT